MRKDLGLVRALAVILVIFSFYITAYAAPPLYDIQNAKYHGIRADADPAKYRLSRDIIPSEYHLEITVVLDESEQHERFTAPGVVTIRVGVIQEASPPPQSIRLHSETITINQGGIQILFPNGTAASAVQGLEEDREAQTVTILLASPLQPGQAYDVVIPFIAIIPDGKQSSFGLYRSSYVNANGVTRYYALTDFESVDARRMTPCFDEPDMKARWTISVIRQKSYKSLSNTDLGTTESIDDTWDRDTFTQTDPMSTYLVAIAVSDYVDEPAPAGLFNKPVTIWGPPPMMLAPYDGGKYAADMSANAMQFFETYLSVPYTFPKMDKFAVQDFSAGAMENWGLNTYRIIRLMYFEGESTIQDKVTMTNTIAHELAHQWFGNLVTMSWWDDIWLNEGFATHFANLASSGQYPEYGWNDYVVVDSVQYAMQADVRGTAHPLHFDGLLTPAETRFGFDTISYDKGASILRMTVAFLSEDIFKAGMTNYLNARRSQNANQDELFQILQETPNVSDRLDSNTVKQILDTWTLQSGFPVITVTRSTASPNVITVTQEQYVNDSRVEQPRDKTWFVPITYQTSTVAYDPAKIVEWLPNNNDPKTLTVTPTSEEFLIINPEQTGYYRVKYDDVSYNLILQALAQNPSPLNQKTRSAIIDDYLNFAFAGYIPIKQGLDVTTYLTQERNRVPWATFVTNMALPYRLLSRTGAFYNFRKYVRALMSPALLAINVQPGQNEHVSDVILLRNRLFEWSCNLGLKECVDFSKSQVETWRQDPTTMPASLTIQPDLRPFVYCTAVANADNTTQVFNFILDRYAAASADRVEADQLSLLRALACSQELFRLNALVDMALQPTSPIREAHRLPLIQAIAGNTLGTSVVIDSLRDKTDVLIERLGLSSISSIITTLSSYLSSSSEIGDINRFVTTNGGKLDGIAASLNASITTMESNKKWIENNYNDMRAWLIDNSV